jgi:hypothetical protein
VPEFSSFCIFDKIKEKEILLYGTRRNYNMINFSTVFYTCNKYTSRSTNYAKSRIHVEIISSVSPCIAL